MISSCKDCLTKCCRSGDGSKPVPFKEWFKYSLTYKGYNTRCQHFDLKTEECQIWDRAPNECRTFVCGNRSFTKEELENIKKTYKRKMFEKLWDEIKTC